MRHPSYPGIGVCSVVVAVVILCCGAEQCLAQEPGKAGISKEEGSVFRGEVVEVTGDTVRVAVKDKQQPRVGDSVKISFEIPGADIKANVAKGRVAKVEPGFATVNITDKTAEIRKGYLAEFAWTTTLPGVVVGSVVDSTSANYLPDDCFQIGSFDIADFMTSKLYQELKTQIKEFDLRALEDPTRISLDNLARITLATTRIGESSSSTETSIITTLRPITAADISAKMKPLLPSDKNYRLDQIKVGSFTLYEESYQLEVDGKLSEPRKGRAFCIVEEKTVIFGYRDALEKILKRDRKPALATGVEAELKSGLSGGFTVIIDVRALLEHQRKSLEKDLGQAIPGIGEVSAGVKVFAVRGNAANDVTASATLTCKDKASAESAKSAADAGLAMLKLALGKDGPQDSADIKKAKQTIVGAFGAIKLSSQDSQVRAEVSIDAAAAANIIRAAFEIKKAEEKDREDKSPNLTGEWTMKASEKTAFGTEYTGAKSFRLEKKGPYRFRNPGSSNATIVFVKDEFLFITRNSR